MKFYLGTHQPHWLGTLDTSLFVSDRRLRNRKTFPRARQTWSLDSGGFTELKDYGTWDHGPSPHGYVAAIRRYQDEIGHLDWAAPQDWMCEPMVINGGQVGPNKFVGTHLSVPEHQRRTVENFIELRAIAPDLPIIPVLQGWERDDYLRCVDLYDSRGIDLTAEPTVGLGSVCRREATGQIGQLVETVASLGIRLHGFGVKTDGLSMYGHHLVSADSMAWSYGARRDPPLPGHDTSHKNCANCPEYAMKWRGEVLRRFATFPIQSTLFDWSAA